MSNISNFTLNIDELGTVGEGLRRPESVITTADGTIYCSDVMGGVSVIHPDGKQEVKGGIDVHVEANGINMDKAGNIYIAGIGSGELYKLAPDGTQTTILSDFNGKPLGSINYVWVDSQERLWVSVSTLHRPWFPALNLQEHDGYILLIDQSGVRQVAGGINFTNEIRLDPKEEYLYVAETMSSRILRFAVDSEGSLGTREVVGPDNLDGSWAVDGFAFDSEGNIWVTAILRNCIYVIEPDGNWHTVFSEPNEAALANFVAKNAERTIAPEDMYACLGEKVKFPTSIAFAGDDLKTVYVGGLAMTELLSFQSPVAGLRVPYNS